MSSLKKITEDKIFNNLPVEMLEMILVYLNPIKLRSLRIINRRFKTIIDYIISKERWLNIPISILDSNIRINSKYFNNRAMHIIRSHFKDGYMYVLINGIIMKVINYTMSESTGGVKCLIMKNGKIAYLRTMMFDSPFDTDINDFKILVNGMGKFRNRKGLIEPPNIYP